MRHRMQGNTAPALAAESAAPTSRFISFPRGSALLGAYLQLTKARLSALVLLTTAVGYFLASVDRGAFHGITMIWTLIGTGLFAGAAAALNQVMEMRRDAAMHRTASRPLPSGAMSPDHAVLLAAVMGISGTVILTVAVNVLATHLALLTLLIYVTMYTPMKAWTTLNTLIGAICGAIPPMIGWAAATGELGPGAWALASLLFIWQIPHFLALAWLYRDDYERGHFRMLPVLDRSGQLTCQVLVLTSLMLIPIALTATLLGLAGWFYAVGSTLLGLWMLMRGVRLYRQRTDANARRVFLASLVYLSAVLGLLLIDRSALTTEVPVHQVAFEGASVEAWR